MSVTETATVVSAHGLTKTYGEGEAVRHALNGVSLKVYPREFVAVLGPAGAGKTTLLRCLAGLTAPQKGAVVVEGRDLSRMKEAALAKLRREQMGFVLQDANLIETMSALENILLPAAIAKRDVNSDVLEQVISDLNLEELLAERPANLSAGDAQKVACARALVDTPAIIFADEPTGTLDSVEAAHVLHFLREAVDSYGHAVLTFTNHPQVAAWADRVILLRDGKLSGEVRYPTPELLLEAFYPAGSWGKPTRDFNDFVESGPAQVTGPTTESGILETTSPDGEGSTDEEPLPGSLDEIAPPRPLPEEQVEIITRAQRILADLPGSITNREP